MATVTGTAKKTKFGNLKKGSVLSETQYYVVEKLVADRVQVKTDGGEPIILPEEYVNALTNVADFYSKEEKKTRTELAEVLLAHPYTAMTVSFQKQVKQEDVLKEILDTYKNAAPKDAEAAFKKSVKNALEGVERVATGRHHGGLNEQGRVIFIDMEKEKGANPAWDARTIAVDTRGINWIIVAGTKYIVK